MIENLVRFYCEMSLKYIVSSDYFWILCLNFVDCIGFT